MFRAIRWLITIIVVATIASLLVAFVLVFTQSPSPLPERETTTFNFEAVPRANDPPPFEHYTTRRGDTLNVRHYPAQSSAAAAATTEVDPNLRAAPVESSELADAGASTETTKPPLVILIHGSGWHGLQHHRLASYLANTIGADVLVPDLRGHGFTPERRGDVDYIGQLEDDLADLIAAYRKDEQDVYFLGHSSGGGLVVRMAGGPHRHLLNGAILLAPYLGYDAPTTRADSGGWAQSLTRRIIGLTILNQFGITGWNDRTVLQFHFPPEVLNGPLGHTATPSYSYRMMVSYAPRPRLQSDLAALPPWLLLVGSNDEAFVAEAYEPLMREQAPEGEVRVLPGLGHLELVEDEGAWEMVGEWIKNREIHSP